MIVFDRTALDALSGRERTKFLNGLSGYKSANLVGTVDSEGRANLSLVSSVFHVGASPPLLGMLIRPHSVPRHTLENLIETDSYTLNHVSDAIHERAHATSARFERGVSEFDASGLTESYSAALVAPYVAEAPVQIGLRPVERHTLDCNGCVLVIGEVIELRLARDTRNADGHLDLAALGVVAISGLDDYHRPESLGRLAYAMAPSNGG